MNNWHVTSFRIKKSQDEINPETSSAVTNVEEISINSEGTPDRGVTSIEVDLSEEYQVNYKEMAENLCQFCLNKTLSAFEYSKWKAEDKAPINAYWIVDSQKENKVAIDVYELLKYK